MNEQTGKSSHSLDYLFHPRSVAVVGVSNNAESQAFSYFRDLLEFPFQGPVYAVGRDEQEVQGQKCYQSVCQIPGPVDHVISCIPHHRVLSLVDDCADKGVRCIHLYTARMAETQLEDRKGLEGEVVQRAQQAGIRIIGPNCMGLFCPDIGLTFRKSFPKETGKVAFVSQSGGNAVDLDYQGAGRGLRFSKIISFGNGSDLNESDFLDHLLDDTETNVIGLYLEGVKDGRRFLDVLRRAQGRKPIVLYKGGRTEAGSRAAASHTASMSGQLVLWEAVCRQFGVVKVESMQEMADVLLAFQFLPPAAGKKIVLVGGGGGNSVAAADTCEEEGFEIPPISSEMKDEMRAFDPEVANLFSNPIDGSAMGGFQTVFQAYTMGFQWDGADLVIANSSPIWLMGDPEGVERHEMGLEFMIDLAQKISKPVVLYVDPGDSTEPWRVEALTKVRERCQQTGIPVYPSIRRAARSLACFTGYHRQ